MIDVEIACALHVRILYTNATKRYVKNIEYNDSKKRKKNREYPDDNITGSMEKCWEYQKATRIPNTTVEY